MCAASRRDFRRGCRAAGILGALALSSMFPGRSAAKDPPPSATDTPGFAFRLFAELQVAGGNVVFSPQTLALILAMTSEGARGESADQIVLALGRAPGGDTGKERSDTHLARPGGELDATEGGGLHLRIANALWVQAGFRVFPDFVAEMRSRFGALVASCDFESAPEDARETINAFAQQATDAAIRDVIPPGLLNPQTRVVLVNAVHFKGNWKHPFAAGRTFEAPFFATPRQSLPVSFMSQRHRFRLLQTPEFQMLEMPYANDAGSMLILLPRERDGLPALERATSAEKLRLWRREMRENDVAVLLPRFRVHAQYDLEPALRALGINDVFDPRRADLSGLTGTKDLFVSAVVHQAVIEVNEAGTEAAAAGGVVIAQRGLNESVVPFRADHPFLFAVVEPGTGDLLFLGRFSRPE